MAIDGNAFTCGVPVNCSYEFLLVSVIIAYVEKI